MEISSSERVANSRAPSSSSCARRASGERRVRAADVVTDHSPIDGCSIKPIPSPHAPTHTALPASVDHLVVGAGFAGLGTAIKLAESGEDDFLVVEKDGDVGGTWRDNTYPGAACDVPSQLYSFSFAPNPDWSLSFSPQPEIQAYLRDVAERSGTLDRFRFGTELTEARVGRGRPALARHHEPRRRSSPRTLVSGSGGLSEPKMPEIDGIETFQGEVFHSARWNHDFDLTGKRVAIIGTGASAIQIVPAIRPTWRTSTSTSAPRRG